MDKESVLLDSEDRMDKALGALDRDFSRLRTGRASTGLVDNIKVDYYGTPTPISQLASVAIPDSRTITIQPWDRGAFAGVEKAILKSDLGLTPVNDGKIIRISIPPLTEDRREELPAHGDRQQPVVEGIVAEDVGEEARHHDAEAVVGDGPGGMLARTAAPEIAPGDEDLPPVAGIVQRERRDLRARSVVTPVAEKVVAEALAFGGFQKARRNDLVGIYVFHLDGHRPRSESHEFGY